MQSGLKFRILERAPRYRKGEGDLRELATVLDERPAALGRTVFKTVGVAVQDWAIARLLGAVPPG